jgi:hypothetical protein
MVLESPTAPAASRHLRVDDLLDQATRTAGLKDFGDPWFLKPLAQLVEFINTEACLLSNDCPSVHVIRGNLVDRLRLVEFVKNNPKVCDENVDVAGIVIGLPRGGSTMLQRVLCSSPQLTAPYYWESMSPFPTAGEKAGDPTPRINLAQAILDNMDKVWPGSTDIHPMSATAYDEESYLISRSFLSVDYIFYFHLPSYVRWHLTQDQSKAYAELKLWLQVLQYQDPSRREKKWVLKSGHHLWCGGLRYLLKTFPNAKALMTHRSLEHVIPSVCSLQSVFIRSQTRDFDARVLGPEAIRLYKDAIEDLIQVRKEEPPERFVDLQYKDLVADPLAQFRRALAGMNIEMQPDDEPAVTHWIKASQGESHSRHRYSPEEFGVTRERILKDFEFYSDLYLKS